MSFHAGPGKPPSADESPIKLYFTYTKAGAGEAPVEVLAREGESLL